MTSAVVRPAARLASRLEFGLGFARAGARRALRTQARAGAAGQRDRWEGSLPAPAAGGRVFGDAHHPHGAYCGRPPVFVPVGFGSAFFGGAGLAHAGLAALETMALGAGFGRVCKAVGDVPPDAVCMVDSSTQYAAGGKLTAVGYGAEALSEMVLADGCDGGTAADELIVSTKVGYRLRPAASPDPRPVSLWDETPKLELSQEERCYRRDEVWLSLAQSFTLFTTAARLAGKPTPIPSALGLALIHDPEAYLNTALGEGLDTLLDLRRAGVLREIGMGTNFVSTALEAGRRAIPLCLPAGRQTPLCTEGAQGAPAQIQQDAKGGEALLGLAREKAARAAERGSGGFVLLSASTTNGGAIWNNTYNYAPASKDVQAWLDGFLSLCQAEGQSPLEVAAQWAPVFWGNAFSCNLSGPPHGQAALENLRAFYGKPMKRAFLVACAERGYLPRHWLEQQRPAPSEAGPEVAKWVHSKAPEELLAQARALHRQERWDACLASLSNPMTALPIDSVTRVVDVFQGRARSTETEWVRRASRLWRRNEGTPGATSEKYRRNKEVK